jgi:hypothetical protein
MFREVERFTPARAFDIIACYNGLTYAIEVKHRNNLSAIPFASLTEFERRCLVGVGRAGGASLLVISYACQATDAQVKRYGLSSSRVRELHVVPFGEWERLERDADENGKKSVSYMNISLRSHQAMWAGKGFWDIAKVLYDLRPSPPDSWDPSQVVPDWEPFDPSRFGRKAEGE